MQDYDSIQKLCNEKIFFSLKTPRKHLDLNFEALRQESLELVQHLVFMGTKTLTTGEGGMLILDDEDIYKDVSS